MGHFSYTCSISGLGISGGTPVRCLLLTSSPWGDNHSPAWVVRTPPIRAEYNDYGTIENVNPEDQFVADMWLRGFKEDLVEKGVGDNHYHDLATTKDMTFEQLLETLRAGRVEVMQDLRHFWRRPMGKQALIDIGEDATEAQEPLDRPQPMFQRVSFFLRQIDKIVTDAREGYLVDEPVPYCVRVRWGKYIPDLLQRAHLERAKVALEKVGFAAMITKGSGRYPNNMDLIVMYPPSTSDVNERFWGPQWDRAKGQEADDDKIMKVRMAMVREDVWQALIAYPHDMYVSLDCTNCGQSSCYHERDRQCPKESINDKPYKEHAKGATYAHGPVFPAGVEHLVVQRWGSEYAWYGLAGFKAGVHGTWKKIVTYFDRRDRRERGEAVEPDPDDHGLFNDEFWKHLEEARANEVARIAALPAEERAKVEAENKAQQERWEAHQKDRRDNPVFGDYLIEDERATRSGEPGGWAFRKSDPGVIGISEHMSMCLADKKKVPALVLDGIAELMAVKHAMREVGVVWKPASNTGPQDVEWTYYLRFVETLAQICTDKEQRRCRDNGEPLEKLPTTLPEAFAHFGALEKKQPETTTKKPAKKKKKTTKKAAPKPASTKRTR